MNKQIEIDKLISGNKVLLIITGLGGTTKGYENKYHTIAEQAYSKGYSVFIATTPIGSWDHPDENLEYIINNIRKEMALSNIFSFKITAVGYSAGGTFLTWLAHKYSEIINILSINPVLNVNIHKMISGLDFFSGQVKIVIGDRDQSYKFSPILKKSINPNLSVTILPDADHKFSNNLKLFIDLILNFLD